MNGGSVSLDSSYDFARFTNLLRSGQLISVVIEILVLHSDSASLSIVAFFFYSSLIAIVAIHLSVRWYYNLDGRYDLKQLIREPDNRLKATYAVALFSPLVLGFLAFKCVSLTPGMPYTAFRAASLSQWLMALALVLLEGYEVFIKN